MPPIRTLLVMTAAGLLTMSSGAIAALSETTAVITADNHYALYTGTASALNWVGGNEIGTGGSPGVSNWSMAETWTFRASGYIYIAAWSDDSGVQGLLAQITLPGGVDRSGGAFGWEVYPTFQDRGTGSLYPTLTEMNGHLAKADAGNLWQMPFVGGTNGIAPWGTIDNIRSTVRWMWVNVPNRADPMMDGGSGYGETLIFRIAVPTPGAAAVLGLGGLMAGRRRRR